MGPGCSPYQPAINEFVLIIFVLSIVAVKKYFRLEVERSLYNQDMSEHLMSATRLIRLGRIKPSCLQEK